MNLFILLLAIELSGMEGMQSLYEPGEKNIENYYDWSYYLKIDVGIEIKKLFYIQGSVKILMYKKIENYEFYPTALSSFIEAGLKHENFSIGIRHICIHPITPYIGATGVMLFTDQWADEIFIRYETKQGFF